VFEFVGETDLSCLLLGMGVWEGVAMNSLKFHPRLLCPTLLRPACGPPLKQPYRGAGGMWSSSTHLDTPLRTPLLLGTMGLLYRGTIDKVTLRSWFFRNLDTLLEAVSLFMGQQGDDYPQGGLAPINTQTEYKKHHVA
jgi:hypothetical protein